MNIFAVDRSPLICARALDDKRLVKMILETAQILCTVVNLAVGEQITQYKNSHVNHPITKWAKDRRNFNWLTLLGNAYSNEFSYRFGKRHASTQVIEDVELEWLVSNIENGRKLPLWPISFHNAARRSSLGIDFTHVADTHLAYRLYLNARWPGDKRKPVWTRRGPPKWAVLSA